jgi:hypothetical protein
MYHTIQFPLCVYLSSSTQREPTHTHGVYDGGEHRLDCPHASAIEVSSPIGIKAFYHPLRGADGVVPLALVGLGHLSDFGCGLSETFLSNRACPAFGFEPSEGLSGVSVLAFPVRTGGFHRLSGRTDEGARGVEVKLSGGEVFPGFRGSFPVDGFAFVLLKIRVSRVAKSELGGCKILCVNSRTRSKENEWLFRRKYCRSL